MTEKETVAKVIIEIQNANDVSTIDFVFPSHNAKKNVGYHSMREYLLLYNSVIIRFISNNESINMKYPIKLIKKLTF
jgi:hypothetical protein